MSTDGQDFNKRPVDPSADTQPQPVASTTEGMTEQQQSRRKFLRTAVVSGVAVAAVGATAGVAAASNGNSGLLKSLGVPFSVSSGSSCNMCFEDTTFGQINDEFNVNAQGKANPGDFWLWFTAQNLPADTYTISVSPDPGATPFKYSSNSNNVKLYQLSAGSATQCPSALPKNNPDSQADDVSSLAPYTTSGTADLQVAIHFKWDNVTTITGDHMYTFNATISNGSGTVCSSSITITAHGPVVIS